MLDMTQVPKALFGLAASDRVQANLPVKHVASTRVKLSFHTSSHGVTITEWYKQAQKTHNYSINS